MYIHLLHLTNHFQIISTGFRSFTAPTGFFSASGICALNAESKAAAFNDVPPNLTSTISNEKDDTSTINGDINRHICGRICQRRTLGFRRKEVCMDRSTFWIPSQDLKNETENHGTLWKTAPIVDISQIRITVHICSLLDLAKGCKQFLLQGSPAQTPGGRKHSYVGKDVWRVGDCLRGSQRVLLQFSRIFCKQC